MTETPNIQTASLKISAELHQRLKIEAAQKGTKIQILAEQAIEQTLEKSPTPTRKKKEVAL